MTADLDWSCKSNLIGLSVFGVSDQVDTNRAVQLNVSSVLYDIWILTKCFKSVRCREENVNWNKLCQI